MCASVAACYGVCFDRHAAFSWPLLANALSAASLHAIYYHIYIVYLYCFGRVYITKSSLLSKHKHTLFCRQDVKNRCNQGEKELTPYQTRIEK